MLATTLLILVTYTEQINALQIMLKSKDWYCMTVSADITTVLEVDYLVTGLNPD